MYKNVNGKPLTDDLTIVFIELAKIEKLLYKLVDELNEIDRWAIFLRYASDNTKKDIINQILKKEEGIKMAAQVLETISKDEREQMLIESQLLYEADQAAVLSYIKRTVVNENANQIAKILKMKNIPLDIISESTGISIDVLETL